MKERNWQGGGKQNSACPTVLPGLFSGLFFIHESEDNLFRDVGELLRDYTALHPRDIHTNTDLWEGFLKYAVEIGSVAMTYIPSSIKAVP
jgi:hypothetical protein